MNSQEVKNLLFNNLKFLKENIENNNSKKSDSVNSWLSKQLKNNSKQQIKIYVKSK